MSNKLEMIRLTHENGKVTVSLYYWNNTQQSIKMTQEDFLERMGVYSPSTKVVEDWKLRYPHLNSFNSLKK